jgi:hypothetical protein
VAKSKRNFAMARQLRTIGATALADDMAEF